MSAFIRSVKALRTDISDWLVHFTKGPDDVAAKTLTSILAESALRSFSDPFVICFSEAPLFELNKLFGLYSKYAQPMFAPFGVAVRKNWLFQRNGRHVIYSPEDEFDSVGYAQRSAKETR